MKVFFISGIGADARLFTYIQLPPGFDMVPVPWITALPGESLETYAIRLFQPYTTTDPFVLAGLSLGGMVATEIAKKYPPLCTILFSSVPLAGQLPPYYGWAAKLRLHRLMPPFTWKVTATCKHYLGMRRMRDKKLMQRVIWAGDSRFIQWGMQAVLQWKNNTAPSPFYHIHGTRDEVFPIRYARPTHVIPGAGHMMVITHAAKVNAILRDVLTALLPDGK